MEKKRGEERIEMDNLAASNKDMAHHHICPHFVDVHHKVVEPRREIIFIKDNDQDSHSKPPMSQLSVDSCVQSNSGAGAQLQEPKEAVAVKDDFDRTGSPSNGTKTAADVTIEPNPSPGATKSTPSVRLVSL